MNFGSPSAIGIASDGIAMADAMRAFGLDPARIGEAARRPGEFLGYLELHIEQGPVRERLGISVGCVTAIAGATRLRVTIDGMAGHAGTAPMQGRHDALTAAANVVLAVEGRAAMEDGLVGAVGRLELFPGAVNVIPGRAVLGIDLRSAEDAKRERMVAEAIGAEGYPVRLLPSGAGHHAMEIAALTPIGMTFARCRKGISHHPDEHADEADIAAGARALLHAITHFSATELS